MWWWQRRNQHAGSYGPLSQPRATAASCAEPDACANSHTDACADTACANPGTFTEPDACANSHTDACAYPGADASTCAYPHAFSSTVANAWPGARSSSCTH